MAGESIYFAYLLRLWADQTRGTGDWRASLEDPHTGQQTGFRNLETLFAYLGQLTKGQASGGQDEVARPGEAQ